MQVAILATGPSLSRLNDLPLCDFSIAIKRAGIWFACDYCCILDIHALKDVEPQLIGNPRLLTRRAYRPKYTTRPGLDVESLICPVLNFDHYTACAALALAWNLGAAQIHVYGVDWTNEPDFDGNIPTDMNRTAQRWDRERGIWTRLVDWLDSKGVKVLRYGITG